MECYQFRQCEGCVHYEKNRLNVYGPCSSCEQPDPTNYAEEE